MLDITSFSNALQAGSVSYVRSLGTSVVTDRAGRVRLYAGDDAVVYPLERRDTRVYALRVPLRADDARNWPERYADLQAETGDIHRFLPADMTILDSEARGEPELALLYSWIPGDTLADVMRFRPTASKLDSIVDSLADLADVLQLSGYAHGDIAPGNLIVRPDNSVALIDLDRMGPLSGGNVIPRRRPGYRLTDAEAGAEAEDAFALLVLMASVAIAGGMVDVQREVETERGQHAPLVFSSWDLLDPGRSGLVRQLEDDLTGLPALLLEYLIGACTAPGQQAGQILKEAVHDVRRTPGWTRSRSRTIAGSVPMRGPDPEDQTGSGQEFDTWDDDPWSPASFNAPTASTSAPARATTSVRADPLDTSDLLERFAALSSVERPPAATRRHRQRAESRREHIARELREALATNNRDVLVRLAMSGDIAELGDSDRSDLVMVLRALSYEQIVRVVASDQDAAIIAAIDPEIFASDEDLDEAFRARVSLARERDAWVSRVIEAVQKDDPDRCAQLLTVTPHNGSERLPRGIRKRLERITGIAAMAADVRRAIDQRNITAVVGAMAKISALTGNWAAHVDAEDVVAVVGYPRIRQRVSALIASGALAREDQWLIDCVVAAGELEDVARQAGLTPPELRELQSAR